MPQARPPVNRVLAKDPPPSKEGFMDRSKTGSAFLTVVRGGNIMSPSWGVAILSLKQAIPRRAKKNPCRSGHIN
jgi:hypothetical protein